MKASTVGVRTEWTCEACGDTERVYHVALAAGPTLNLPRGWTIHNGGTYCPKHVGCRIGLVLE